jgi:hypothetical protein
VSKKRPEDLKRLRLDELEDQITELAGHSNAANYRWLTLIAEFDRRNGWCDGKLHSCAHWLNFKVGLNLGAAREKIRVAHGVYIGARTAATRWAGERMDYDLEVFGLFSSLARAQRVSAETSEP